MENCRAISKRWVGCPIAARLLSPHRHGLRPGSDNRREAGVRSGAAGPGGGDPVRGGARPAIGVAPVLWGGADGCVRHSATATQVSSNRTHSRLGGGRRPRGPWGAKGDRQVDALGAPLGARGLAWAGEAMLRFFGGNHPSRRTTVHADAASAATAVSAVCGKCASGVHSRNPEYPHGVDGAAFPQVAEEVRVAAAACVADDEGSLFCLARLARPSPCPECSRLKSFSRSGIACTGTRRRVRRTTVTGPGGGRCGSPGRGLRGRARPGHG